MIRRPLLWVAGNSRLQQAITKNPITSKAAHRFVAGERLEEGLDAAAHLNRDGIGGILDLLGEGVTDTAGATAAVEEYVAAAEAIARRELDATISIKLSQLGQTVDRDACVTNLARILDRAQAVGVPVEIDMEDSSLVADTIELYREALTAHPQVRLAIQVMLRRTPFDLEDMAPLKPRVRLVKGAYAEPPSVAHPQKRDVDRSYAELLALALETCGFVAIATHDEAMLAEARRLLQRDGAASHEFQMLFGVRNDRQRSLAATGEPVRVCVPFGGEWYVYLGRRLAERPANLWFLLRNLVR